MSAFKPKAPDGVSPDEHTTPRVPDLNMPPGDYKPESEEEMKGQLKKPSSR